MLEVIAGTTGANPNLSILQFSMVLLVLSRPGLSQRELAALLNCNESTISRAYKQLSANTPPCLVREDGLIYADQHVIETINTICGVR